jgi:hypothetical protein
MQQLSNKDRFCSQCQLVVTDFSSATKEEFDEKIKNAKGRICGRFSKSQMNGDYLAKIAATLAVASVVACTPDPIIEPSLEQAPTEVVAEQEFLLGDIGAVYETQFTGVILAPDDSTSSEIDSLSNEPD